MNKVKPKILSGFMELLPPDQIQFNEMYDTIRKVYEQFGYMPMDTPIIEYAEVLFAKAGGETEKQIYRFNKGDNDLALRFDLTVPLARFVSQHSPDLVFPFKRYQMNKVFRGERPQKGRFREFYQCDIDVIGNESLDRIYDAEIPAVIYHVFQKLDIGKFTIRINNRKILTGFFDGLELKDQITDILRVIDKIDKIGRDAVVQELLRLEIEEEKVDKIMKFVETKGNNEEIIKSLKNIPTDNAQYIEGVEEIEEVCQYLKNFGVDDSYYKIDLTIARGLDYYTGTVYETILNDYPKLGSICSGGRYDNLAEYYTDQKLPGIGISIGLTRLFSQLRENNIIQNKKKSLVKSLVIPMTKDDLSYAILVSAAVRSADIKTDVYYLDKGIKQKFKYADRLGIPFVIVLGTEEREQKKVTLKNMESGEQEVLTINEAIQIIQKLT